MPVRATKPKQSFRKVFILGALEGCTHNAWVGVFVDRGDEVNDLLFGHTHLRQQIAGDVVEGVAVVLHQRTGHTRLPVQIIGQTIDHVEVSFQLEDRLFVLDHANSISLWKGQGNLRVSHAPEHTQHCSGFPSTACRCG